MQYVLEKWLKSGGKLAKNAIFRTFFEKIEHFLQNSFSKKMMRLWKAEKYMKFQFFMPKIRYVSPNPEIYIFSKKCILKGFSTKLHVEYSTVARIKYWKNFPKQILQTFRLEVGDRLCYIHHHTEMLIQKDRVLWKILSKSHCFVTFLRTIFKGYFKHFPKIEFYKFSNFDANKKMYQLRCWPDFWNRLSLSDSFAKNDG